MIVPTTTTAKDYLNSIRAEDFAIQCIIERSSLYADMAACATSSTEAERVSGTGSRSRVEDCVCRKIDYETSHHLTERIDKLADMRQEAWTVINIMESTRFRQVLMLRYLQNQSWRWTWGKIATQMGISVVHAHRLHGYALLEYERQKHNMLCSAG